MTQLSEIEKIKLINSEPNRFSAGSKSWFLFKEFNGTEKSLKIPKGQSESVYRRRTDNTFIHVIAPAMHGSLTQMSPQKTITGYKPFSPAYP